MKRPNSTDYKLPFDADLYHKAVDEYIDWLEKGLLKAIKEMRETVESLDQGFDCDGFIAGGIKRSINILKKTGIVE